MIQYNSNNYNSNNNNKYKVINNIIKIYLIILYKDWCNLK